MVSVCCKKGKSASISLSATINHVPRVNPFEPLIDPVRAAPRILCCVGTLGTMPERNDVAHISCPLYPVPLSKSAVSDQNPDTWTAVLVGKACGCIASLDAW